jgi:murein DD-endopeptidase MepM/ murein hydrolase activator NlpD
MPRSVPPRHHTWPRVAVLALIGVSAAACSDSGRFQTASYGPNVPPQEVTASVPAKPAASDRVVAQPLPAPSQLPTVAARGGVATGAQGLGAYRPSSTEITGSVSAPRAAPAPTGHWTWDGGSPVTVGNGETVEMIARKYGVPVVALRQTNNLVEAGAVRPGQRIVIPRYVTASAPQAPAPEAVKRERVAESVHVVAPGETLMTIAHKHGVSLTALAKANKIKPFGPISIGQRLTVPGGHPVAAGHQAPAVAQMPAPRVAQPRTMPVEKVAAAPVQSARIATPETKTTESVAPAAQPAGNLPAFRWPVKGRIIAGFGPSPNGTQNDGINLAVPEGTPVKAADDGVVAYAGNELKGYGNLVLIRHSNGYVSAYANASQLLVKRGDTIKRGQVIAHAGQTGNVTSPQLHFEIRKGSTPVDPTKYLGGV